MLVQASRGLLVIAELLVSSTCFYFNWLVGVSCALVSLVCVYAASMLGVLRSSI